jgi:spermidine synthase
MRMPLRGRLRDLLTAPSGVTGAAVETAVETSPHAEEAATPTTRRAALLARLPLLTLVFVGGMSSMSLEMCASRLMAPYFGTSLFVWANLIGLVLIYLSTGYFIGGRLADRYPSPRLLCTLTAIAAVYTGLIPFISKPALELSVRGLDPNAPNAGVFIGSMLAVILLFLVPVTLLGVVSPFAVRLSVRAVGSTGRSAGGLYSLSTAGSIVGTFLPVLALIPAWGVQRTIIATGVALLAASLWGLRLPVRAIASLPAAVLLVPLLLPQIAPLGPLKAIPGMIYEQESFYNYIQVVQDPDGTRKLVLNEGQAVHSIYNPDRVLTGPEWYNDYILAAPFFNSGAAAGQLRRVGIIGLAGGTIARQVTAAFGPIPIDGVELDPAVVDVGRRYFGMTEPNLHVYVGDGRTFLRATHETYDLVNVDAYQQPYIPFHLATKEFFEEIKAHLSPTGAVTVTTGHTRTDRRLVDAFVKTLSAVYPSVYTMDIPETISTEIIATVSPTSIGALSANFARLPLGSLLSVVGSEVLPVVQEARPRADAVLFTDDRAPIEQITDQLILSYIQNK